MKFFYFVLLLIPLKVWCQGFVSEIDSPKTLISTHIDPQYFKEGDRVIIASQYEKKIVAFGTINKMGVGLESNPAQIKIDEVIDNSLVTAGDLVFPMDIEVMKQLKAPGFFSLTMNGSHVPAQYKELAYFGVFTSEGHTLDQHEVLISPFQIQFGLTDKVGVKVVTALFLDGYTNAGLKYQFIKNNYVKFTANTFVGYKLSGLEDWIWQIGGVVSTASNAKFQNHLMFNFTMDKQFLNARATENLGLYQDSDIRNITEYITDNWNRVLFGPTFNFELQTFGGTISYMFIWNMFHTSLGVATKDFTSLSYGKDGYYYVYDLFWRF